MVESGSEEVSSDSSAERNAKVRIGIFFGTARSTSARCQVVEHEKEQYLANAVFCIVIVPRGGVPPSPRS